MSIPEHEGVYLLCSCDAFEKRIYKVGRSDNLRQRLASYPPNWCLLDCLPCDDSSGMERVLIRGFRTNFKTYDRNEYFEIDADFYEIKHFFNNLMFETRAKTLRTPEPKKEKLVVPEPKKEKEKQRADFMFTLSELRADQLEIFKCESKKDVEDRVREFNKLIDVILRVKDESKNDQVTALVTQLNNLVSKKRSRDIANALLKEGLGGVTAKLKIEKKEYEAKCK